MKTLEELKAMLTQDLQKMSPTQLPLLAWQHPTQLLYSVKRAKERYPCRQHLIHLSKERLILLSNTCRAS
jgi:hypothetical protein